MIKIIDVTRTGNGFADREVISDFENSKPNQTNFDDQRHLRKIKIDAICFRSAHSMGFFL